MREILHISSLATHTTLNTYKHMEISLMPKQEIKLGMFCSRERFLKLPAYNFHKLLIHGTVLDCNVKLLLFFTASILNGGNSHIFKTHVVSDHSARNNKTVFRKMHNFIIGNFWSIICILPYLLSNYIIYTCF